MSSGSTWGHGTSGSLAFCWALFASYLMVPGPVPGPGSQRLGAVARLSRRLGLEAGSSGPGRVTKGASVSSSVSGVLAASLSCKGAMCAGDICDARGRSRCLQPAPTPAGPQPSLPAAAGLGSWHSGEVTRSRSAGPPAAQFHRCHTDGSQRKECD